MRRCQDHESIVPMGLKKWLNDRPVEPSETASQSDGVEFVECIVRQVLHAFFRRACNQCRIRILKRLVFGRDGEETVVWKDVDMVAGLREEDAELVSESWETECGDFGKSGTHNGVSRLRHGAIRRDADVVALAMKLPEVSDLFSHVVSRVCDVWREGLLCLCIIPE